MNLRKDWAPVELLVSSVILSNTLLTHPSRHHEPFIQKSSEYEKYISCVCHIVKPSCCCKLLFHSIHSTTKDSVLYCVFPWSRQEKCQIEDASIWFFFNFKLVLEYFLTGNRKISYDFFSWKKAHIKTIFPAALLSMCRQILMDIPWNSLQLNPSTGALNIVNTRIHAPHTMYQCVKFMQCIQCIHEYTFYWLLVTPWTLNDPDKQCHSHYIVRCTLFLDA